MESNNSLEKSISCDWTDIDNSLPSNNFINDAAPNNIFLFGDIIEESTLSHAEKTITIEEPKPIWKCTFETNATPQNTITLPPLNLEKSNSWINDSILCFNEQEKDANFTGPTQVSNWIIPQIFLCGGYICSDTDLTLLKNAGITRFVCLNAEYGTNLLQYYEYARSLTPESFIHIPVKDMNITDDDIIKQKCSEIANMILSGERVYIHCSGGHGRTGTFVALVLNILYPDLSIQDMFDYIQYSHDQRYYNKFGNLLWTRYLKNMNSETSPLFGMTHDECESKMRNCEKENTFADNFAPGQVPTPQTLVQRRQVLRLWKYPETEYRIKVPQRK
jgi:hypothetical protein